MITNELSKILGVAFEKAGYDRSYGDVVISNRKDLCQFQCNGSLRAAKQYKMAPIMIAKNVLENIDSDIFSSIEAINPGFININLKDEYIANHINKILGDERFGIAKEGNKKVVIDYGGPNVAKPLHIGHLRPAIIGESIKRILKFYGYDVIGDVHLGDWGLQMGMIIEEVKLMYPELPYFDEDFEGEYPKEAPFSFEELENIYPIASAKSKEDEAYKERAKKATFDLQNGKAGYRALWKHFVDLSIKDIKGIYDKLNVEFDLWLGESDCHEYIDDVIGILKDNGSLYESDGAMVVDVSREDDKKEIPPIIIIKSDGSILYGTTDLATIYQRMKDENPDYILYVVDSRQSTHFTQVFRCAKDSKISGENTSLEHLGFGTMNGPDGKPFKTRDGGILKLNDFLNMVRDNAKEKIKGREGLDIEKTSDVVGMATLKFADLSNDRNKDYIFDLGKFSSFEGKTGPYILYSYVRINNILSKLEEEGFKPADIIADMNDSTRDLILKIDEFKASLDGAVKLRAPHIIADYVYELATLSNSFYHNNHILNEDDKVKRASFMSLLTLTRDLLKTCLDLLGIDTVEKM